MAGRKGGIHVGLGVEPGVPNVIVLQAVFALELKRENRRNRQPTRTRSRRKPPQLPGDMRL
jgi:hypothetical protein